MNASASAAGQTIHLPEEHVGVGQSRAWSAVGILWLFYVIAFMDRGVISLMVRPIMSDLGITQVQMGLIQGFAFATTYSLAALPLGWAVDHLRRQRVLLAGVFVWSCGTVACGLSHSYEQLVAARAVVGLGEAVLTPTALSLISNLFPKDRIGTATAVFSSGATVGVGAALIVGGGLLRAFTDHGIIAGLPAWKSVFLTFGALGMVLSLLSFLVPDRRVSSSATLAQQPAPPATLNEFVRFLRDRFPLVLCLFIAFPLLLTISNAYLAWIPHHFETAFGWSSDHIGYVLGSLNLICPILGILTGGIAMDRALRAGVRAPHMLVPLISTVIGVPLLAAGLLAHDPTVAIPLLAIGLFVFNAFAAAQGTLIQLLAPPSMRGRFAAVYMLVLSLIGPGIGTILPPLINQAQSATNRGVGWATAIAILAIGALVCPILYFGRGLLHAALTQAGHGRSETHSRT